MTGYHQPVLLNESIDGLNIKPEGIYVDVTFGGGGHSREILKHLKDGRLFGVDQDEDVLENIPDDERFTFIRHNFRFLKKFLKYYQVEQIDGLLADLGVSSHHFDEPDRGFSFRFDSEIDMRMNTKSDFSARDLLNTYSEQDLSKLFWEYGELKNARKVARSIVAYRESNSINETGDLEKALFNLMPKYNEHQFLAKLYQALRIEVNHEVDYLKEMLEQALEFLAPGGRLVVISYHSLEDRIVKTFMKNGSFSEEQEFDLYGTKKPVFKTVNKKIIVPTEEEIKQNNRARSAKLRIAEKV